MPSRISAARPARKFIATFVTPELSDCLAHRIGERGRLALDHGEWQPIRVHDDVGSDVLARPLYGNLLCELERVRGGIVEVEEAYIAVSSAAVLSVRRGNAVREGRVRPFVRFHQVDRRNARDSRDRA